MVCLRESIMKKIPAARRLLLLILCATFFSSLPKVSLALTTITNTKFIQDGQDAETLVSQGEIFELGFFNPSNSTKSRYLGMWYKNISTQTVVWVANRENPLNDSTGILKIGDDGNLVLIDGLSRVLWSTNISKVGHSVVQLTELGNLVLKEESDGTILWQSFDHPSDTLLPGMKLGWDLKTKLDRFLTSWKSPDDPSPGDYTFKLDNHGSPQLLLSQGSDLQYRSGPWNGIRFSGVPEMDSKNIFTFDFFENQDEIYYSFQVVDSSYVSRLLVNSTGQLQRFTSVDQEDENWNLFWWAPEDQCDNYKLCGPYGICNTDDSPVCICAHGFQPKSPEDWFLRNASGGCVRGKALNCPSRDGFLKLEGMKLPDTANAFVDKSMSLEECKDECFNNCSCMAYAAADISSGEGTGCIIWSGDLIDLRQYTTSGQDLYVRLAASDLDTGNSTKKKTIIAITVSIAIAIFLLALGYISIRRWKRQKKEKMGNRLTRKIGSRERSQDFPMLDVVASSGPDSIDEGRAEDLELPLFDLVTIISATNNFSEENKLGEGGFGPVYKGKLLEGQEIAVKRLSKKSGQGIDEFKNEVRLIAKLQHRNLVRLLGCCIKGEEKMLIYEYMQNRSLDSIIFNQTRSPLLDWPKRFNIIMGIARGLLYLHQDSRFRIIHRDLKASNVLLDSQMNPKISDFGMARIFGGDQTEANTVKVVGTFGYMAPEYAMDGVISVKSDVFSFGVIVLEILCGKKNRGFYHEDHHLNLLGHVWCLWKEGRAEEVMDPTIGIQCSMSEFMRCLQVGLLCVQERAEDRPTMSTAVLMLGSENPTLPQPKQPGFSTGRSYFETDSSSSKQPVFFTVNEMTVTMVEGR